MIVKIVEIRDRHTFIPAAAMKMDVLGFVRPADFGGKAESEACLKVLEQVNSLYRSVGFTGHQLILMRLSDQEAHSCAYDWGDSRTMRNAHAWLAKNFDEVENGQVVDVEFILGEKPEPSKPQRLETPQ